MIPETKIDEMVEHVLHIRDTEQVRIGPLVLRRAALHAKIPYRSWREAMQRVGKKLSDRADVAHSRPA